MLAMQFSKSTRAPSRLNSVSDYLSPPSKEFTLASTRGDLYFFWIGTDSRVTKRSTKSEEPGC